MRPPAHPACRRDTFSAERTVGEVTCPLCATPCPPPTGCQAHTAPSPRAAGAPLQSGAAIPGSQHCHRRKDCCLIPLIPATGRRGPRTRPECTSLPQCCCTTGCNGRRTARHSVKHNPGQNGLVQSIPKAREKKSRKENRKPTPNSHPKKTTPPRRPEPTPAEVEAKHEEQRKKDQQRSQTPERKEYRRLLAQEKRRKAKELGLCRDYPNAATPDQTRCETCTKKHRESRRRAGERAAQQRGPGIRTGQDLLTTTQARFKEPSRDRDRTELALRTGESIIQARPPKGAGIGQPMAEEPRPQPAPRTITCLRQLTNRP